MNRHHHAHFDIGREAIDGSMADGENTKEGKPKLSTLMQVMNELKRFYEPNRYQDNDK